MNKRIDFDNLKVEISLRNKGEMKGQIAIEYYGMRITHFRIMIDKKTGEFYLQVPSLRGAFGKYKPMFWVPNDEDFEQFELLLLDKYIEFKEKVKRGETQDNTPLDEIEDIPEL